MIPVSTTSNKSAMMIANNAQQSRSRAASGNMMSRVVDLTIAKVSETNQCDVIGTVSNRVCEDPRAYGLTATATENYPAGGRAVFSQFCTIQRAQSIQKSYEREVEQ